MNLCFFLFVVAVFGPAAITFAIFDGLLRKQYQMARSEWERDGSPRGFFWRPIESTDFGGAWRRDQLLSRWVRKTPVWANSNSECVRMFQWLRVSACAWGVSACIAVGLAIRFFNLGATV